MNLSQVKTYVTGVLDALFPNRNVLSKLSESDGMLHYDDIPVAPDKINYKTGDVILYAGSSLPNGWMECNGAVINIASFRNLSTYIARQFGTVNHFGGDGTTTFAVPDYSSTVSSSGLMILIKY